jgi:hypothetical protein
MSYESDRFFLPWVPDDPFAVGPPPINRKPIPGPSGMVATAQTIDNYARISNQDYSTVTGADQFIAESLELLRAIDPAPQAQLNSQTGVYGVPSGGLGLPDTPAIREGYFPNQPWAEMPANGIPFDEIASIATPAAGAAETTVLRFVVPAGLNGVILGVYNEYTGVGFVQGVGDITWRIYRADKPVRNYNNILTFMGTLQTARVVEGGILIYAGEEIRYTVQHNAGSPLPGPGTRTLAALKGYYWPR